MVSAVKVTTTHMTKLGGLTSSWTNGFSSQGNTTHMTKLCGLTSSWTNGFSSQGNTTHMTKLGGLTMFMDQWFQQSR